MGRFVRGDIVVVPFPFSSATEFKRRPALVLAGWPYQETHDLLLCMITSQPALDPLILPLSSDAFQEGGLPCESYIRPAYLFTVAEERVLRRAAVLKPEIMDAAVGKIIQLLQLT